ncbi:MAG: hypothetical protein UR66_C0010G0038 [Candidatus Moranbacteria bacterium GW2011_GWE1_35_17]|nr:MAG: hypothetical protein UR66_C0010G0038 [Candidatus Moranbacteria bacterium GW2011_GWE1_35_17]KKP83876.1 MAG: hypothetical protein UR82_C0017G0006 [Candidatus Moranbacteria bacterium GW2011_GWF1_35_5]KKP83938.1 MAG: hypothetical protein UR83_C0030G0022 [Candidatus Moranbacteria bacterium GW2011_GWF2_35_54]
MARYKSKSKTAVRNFSEEGLNAVKSNLEVQRKHGAFEFFRKNVAPVPSCNQCIFSSECPQFEKDQKHCRAILELQDEIYEEIFALEYIKPIDKYIMDRFVKNYCFLIIIERWVANIGPFQAKESGLDVQPIMAMKINYERIVLKQADALGIGPQARARLNLTNVQSFCFAEALQRASLTKNKMAEIIIQDDEDATDNDGETY